MKITEAINRMSDLTVPAYQRLVIKQARQLLEQGKDGIIEVSEDTLNKICKRLNIERPTKASACKFISLYDSESNRVDIQTPINYLDLLGSALKPQIQ